MRRPDQRTVRRTRHHEYRQTAEHPLLDGVARLRHGQEPTHVLLRRLMAMVAVFLVAAVGLALVNRSGSSDAVNANDLDAPAASEVQDSVGDVVWSTDAPATDGATEATSAKRKTTSKKTSTKSSKSSKKATTTTTTDAPKKKSSTKKRTKSTTTTTEAPDTTSKRRTTTTEPTTSTSTKKPSSEQVSPPTKRTTTTTTSTTTTTAPTTTTVPKRASYTRAQIIQIIREEWPDELEDKAIQIATRESSLNPNVRNYCCYGLFQLYWGVHQSWMSKVGVTVNDLYDPRVNARLAYQLYLRAGGWSPWSQTAF